MTQPSGLRELEELLARGTPGPWDRTDGDIWVVTAGAMVCCNQPIANRYGEAECCGQPIAEPAQDLVANTSPDNAALIIAAVNSLPALIEVAKALKPFAKAGELFDPRPADSYNEGVYMPAAGREYSISGDDLRAARAALAKLESSNG